MLSLGMNLHADAAEPLHVVRSGPVTACQSALPVFDGNIRKRPLAVANEGTSNAFVTCSFTTVGPELANLVESYKLFVSNAGTGTVDINCTGVGGVQGGIINQAPQSIPLTIRLVSGEKRFFSYFPAQFLGGVLSNYFSVSCSLPLGTSINDMQVFFDEDVDPV
jgi:hypothetical protein